MQGTSVESWEGGGQINKTVRTHDTSLVWQQLLLLWQGFVTMSAIQAGSYAVRQQLNQPASSNQLTSKQAIKLQYHTARQEYSRYQS